jgi:cytoskeletal protein CcmA (bactofilin family)
MISLPGKKNMDQSTENFNSPAETVVGPSVKIQGNLNSEGNIRIDGLVSGKVKTSQNVIIGDAAKIAGDIVAGSAVIAGEIQGNVKIANHLILQSTAFINGDLTCQVLRVEDGAQFTGKCTMGNSGGNSGGSPETDAGRKNEPEAEK